MASIVIPAHNEEAVIGRLLAGLTDVDSVGRCRFDIVVVCNGCTDRTAEIAAGFGPQVRVLESPVASKQSALRAGDSAALAFPRVYVDADVEISAESVLRLVEALANRPVEAVAPRREIPRDGVTAVVRWYYDVWERLPQVRQGLFGRGVIALSEAGNARLRGLPALMGDDLAASDAFDEHERLVVADAAVTVWPPKTVRDLLRRRVRAVTGNAQADRAGIRRPQSITDGRVLLRLAREDIRLVPRIAVFVGVAVVSRVRARRAVRRGDTKTWLRDESSRQSGHTHVS